MKATISLALAETKIDKESHPDAPMPETDLTKRLRVVGEDYAADEEAPELNVEEIEALNPPDRNTPGARPAATEGVVRSSAGSGEQRHHPLDPDDLEAAVLDVIQSPEWQGFVTRLDACPSERVTGYSYRPSQKAAILLVSLLAADHSLKGAHRYVQTHPRLRAAFGFAPMSREVRRASLGKGRSQAISDPNFPSRQAIVKFIDHWLRVRADWVIPLIHDMVAQIAFRTIIDYDLNTTRIVLDTAPIRSGLRKQGKKRRDPGAKHLRHGDREDKKWFGRKLATTSLGEGGLYLWARPLVGHDDGTIAERIMIPTLRTLSDSLKAYAASRKIANHPGFDRAGLFGDSHYCTVPVHGAAYAHGFEPGFTSRDAGKPREMLEAKRRLRIVKETNPHSEAEIREDPDLQYAVLEMDTRGRYYCPCDAGKPIKKREPMTQVPNRFGIDFTLHCAHEQCKKAKVFYWTNRTGGQVELANGHWKRGEVGTLVRTLRHDDRRTLAVSHYTRELHERNHSLLRHMGLLASERLSQRKHITGKFRHDLWYALGAFVFNATINANYANGRVSREELDWDDLYVNAVRNGSQARSNKDTRNANAAEKKGKSAAAAASARNRRRQRSRERQAA